VELWGNPCGGSWAASRLTLRAGMGPRGRFLGQLEPLLQEAKLSRRYEGKVVQVDASIWLHEALVRHAGAVVLERDTSGVIRDVVNRCVWLTSEGARLIVVLDGAAAAAKGEEAKARALKRARAMAMVSVCVNGWVCVCVWLNACECVCVCVLEGARY
jgi:hypothetical protein